MEYLKRSRTHADLPARIMKGDVSVIPARCDGSASHAEFGALAGGGPRPRREWTRFDESAIRKQVRLQTGDL